MKTIKINNWGDRLPENFTGIAEYASGTKEYYVDGKFHRLNGPAVEWLDGIKKYYVDGKLHRTDGPAIEYPNGTKKYFVDGKRHRTDGPAVEYSDGTKEYYVNDISCKSKEAYEILIFFLKAKNLLKQ